jgi:3'(2'), 5'-bisphosphate nucleotidase
MSFIDLMIAASLRAGEIICEVYDREIVATSKADGSPVTEADGLAEAAILEMLTHAGLPVLAEESVSAGRVPKLGDRWFIVDPLDGTREFVKRNGEFTVNIALIEHGRPVEGVVLAQVGGELFWGGPAGAFKRVGGTEHRLTARPREKLRVVGSRSHGHAALAALMRNMDIDENVSVGSSLKFCMLAEGKAELYPRFGPTSEWDTAAGQAVLEAAGGVVLTLDGAPMQYGHAASAYLNPYFVAAVDHRLALDAAREMRALAP